MHLIFWAGFYCLVILRRSFEWNLNSCLNKDYQVTGKEERKKIMLAREKTKSRIKNASHKRGQKRKQLFVVL